MYAAYCERCGEAYAETEPDRASYLPAHDPRADMCGACQRATDSESEAAAPIACLDDGTHVAECGAADTPVRADIDEPKDAAWQALATEFDALDVGLARRQDVREMLLRAWAGGAVVQAASLRDRQHSDAWNELLDTLRDADLSPAQRMDIQDHAAAHVRRCVNEALADDEGRYSAFEDVRIALPRVRERLRDIRLCAGTPAMPVERIPGELMAIDARLGDVDALIEDAL